MGKRVSVLHALYKVELIHIIRKRKLTRQTRFFVVSIIFVFHHLLSSRMGFLCGLVKRHTTLYKKTEQKLV